MGDPMDKLINPATLREHFAARLVGKLEHYAIKVAMAEFVGAVRDLSVERDDRHGTVLSTSTASNTAVVLALHEILDTYQVLRETTVNGVTATYSLADRVMQLGHAAQMAEALGEQLREVLHYDPRRRVWWVGEDEAAAASVEAGDRKHVAHLPGAPPALPPSLDAQRNARDYACPIVDCRHCAAERLLAPSARVREAEAEPLANVPCLCSCNTEISRLTNALQSIAGNSCCGPCREAALVAAKALGHNESCPTCGSQHPKYFHSGGAGCQDGYHETQPVSEASGSAQSAAPSSSSRADAITELEALGVELSVLEVSGNRSAAFTGSDAGFGTTSGLRDAIRLLDARLSRLRTPEGK